MTIKLLRVDERLIHGQVVIGWGSHLTPGRYVVVDDDVADSDWEQELYALGLPDGVDADFVSVEDARRRWAAWDASSESVVLLVRTVEAVVRLAADGGLGDHPVNLGGIHHGPGRRPVLSYLFLDDADVERLRSLGNQGVRVSARDLPGSREVPLSALLG